MTFGPRHAQAIQKMIPGTISGSSKGAQPNSRQIPQRPPAANSAGSPPCACSGFSGGIAGSFAGFDEITDLCAKNFDLSVVNTNNWDNPGGGGEELRLDVVVDPFTAGPYTYRARIALESPGFTTASYVLQLASGAGSWSHTLTGQAVPTAGNTLQLLVTGLMSATIAAVMKVNGVTVLSDSRAALWTTFESMTADVSGVATTGGGSTAHFTNWAAVGTC